MPVVHDNLPIILVSKETALAKYLDLTKFLSLLVKESLFFCRLDKLEDQFEGTPAKKNYYQWVNVQKQVRAANLFNPPPSDEQIIKTVGDIFEFESKRRALTCVNCWNKFENESAALWKIYSDYGKGVMIKTSAKRLEDSLINTSEKIYLSGVKYIDYENDKMPIGNETSLVIHKRKPYNYESEVRLFHYVEADRYWIHDWEKEEVSEGKYFKVSLDALIEEIIIGPYSTNWFTEIVVNLNEKFGLNKPIRKSKLAK